MGQHQDQLGDGNKPLKFFGSCHLLRMNKEQNGKTYHIVCCSKVQIQHAYVAYCMTRKMHALIIATDVAKPHLPKRKKKCMPYVSLLPFQPRSFPSQFRPEGRLLAWSDNSETP